MSTLKVNKLRDTAGSADAITLDPNGGAVLAGVTTMTTARVTSGIVTNTFIVGAGVTISESGIEASGIGITCANINGGQIGGRRNIIINGAMNVAQRGTSSTSGGYETVDRIIYTGTGFDENPTQSQSDVASGTTPYTLGFRKAFKITNGNQTGGGDAGDELGVRYSIEAQDVANSGWNYTSASSFITLSFWVKSSVAQNFYGYLLSLDGTIQRYAFETGALSANTWTKVTKTIPGNSNIQIDNDNGEGFRVEWRLFAGTNFTDSGVSLNTWAAFASGTRTPDSPTGWYTTNDATWELTGVQLEVGSEATSFEHRSFGEELSLCQRYYQRWKGFSDHNGIGAGRGNGSDGVFVSVNLIKCMRAAPSVTNSGIVVFKAGASSTSTSDTPSLTNASAFDATACMFPMSITGLSGITNNYGGYTVFLSSSDLQLNAEI